MFLTIAVSLSGTTGQAQMTQPVAATTAKVLAPQPSGVHDYIPCLLNPDELSRLHGVTPKTGLQATVLSKEQADAVVQEILASVKELVDDKKLSPEAGVSFNTQITGLSLQGSDPSQMVEKVRAITTSVLKDNQAKHLLGSDNSNDIANVIIGAAQAAAKKVFEPPVDVACSMSVLTFNESSDIFGLRVAQEYIAIQIVVRNLNDQDEFLLHDAGLAVDTDPCGKEFSQFDSSRDRLLVRAVALRNQATDPRNRTIRIMEGVGAIAASAVGFASRDYSYGLAVFNSLIPAGKSVFPDYTIDQLNRLSDMAFTASGQNRTVVGKNGAAMFVAFIPAEPLEQSWWIVSRKSETAPLKPADCSQPINKKSVKYKQWSPDSLLEFRRHTFAMVAGVHIAPTDDLKPSFTSEACKKTFTGDLAISGTTDTMFTCPVKGKNLGNVVSMVLRDAKDYADPTIASGTITPAPGDPTQATVSFSVADLKKLTGTDYNMMWVDASKIENATGFVEHIPQASLAATNPVDPPTLTLSALKSGKVTLAGMNLDMVSGVQLKGNDSKISVDLSMGAVTPTSLEATFSPDAIAKLVSGNYTVVLFQGGKKLPVTSAKLTLTKG